MVLAKHNLASSCRSLPAYYSATPTYRTKGRGGKAIGREGCASNPAACNKKRSLILVPFWKKRTKKVPKKKIPVPGFAPGSLAITYTDIGDQRVAITLYGLSKSLTVRPRGLFGRRSLRRVIVISVYILLGGCLPVGNSWWDAAELQAGKCRTADSDWIMQYE